MNSTSNSKDWFDDGTTYYRKVRAPVKNESFQLFPDFKKEDLSLRKNLKNTNDHLSKLKKAFQYFKLNGFVVATEGSSLFISESEEELNKEGVTYQWEITTLET